MSNDVFNLFLNIRDIGLFCVVVHRHADLEVVDAFQNRVEVSCEIEWCQVVRAPCLH